MVSPRINFKFYEIPMEFPMGRKNVVMIEIPCAERQPVQFAGVEYIRVGTNKKNLKEYPDKERELWQAFDTTPYELRLAKSNVTEDELVVFEFPHFQQLNHPKASMPKHCANVSCCDCSFFKRNPFMPERVPARTRSMAYPNA